MTEETPEGTAGTGPRSEGTGSSCRRCGEPLVRGAIAAERRACCLNATPIAGVCPTHGPVGPHHAVDDPSEADEG
ncbi:hypothetical protein GJ633_11060 [Halorubrum sp. CBA1125]|uniref:hypothetical protein n=1 Tax=Halorubrum sp. CBA1125 TaxID=2668072 RepID=UPI0012E8A3B8|nr:hypothetical protein [Halorubrum sp. CBA1125]MUW15130.1 hypothetical protein [Halorubrum sp. CBA1125]